ncbi:MAG: hypothetical protein H0U52_00645 [Chloroflexi bacterium]|nr:hypothetical protein [Chloroflexota bacterium]
MKLVDFLEERAKRRERRFRALLETGRPLSPLDRLPGWPSEQFIIAVAILGLFAGAYIDEADKDTRNLMVGALIAAFAGAWGYFLGSSNSAQKAGDRTDQALALGRDAVKALPAPSPPPEPDVTLKPGETAQAEELGDSR